LQPGIETGQRPSTASIGGRGSARPSKVGADRHGDRGCQQQPPAQLDAAALVEAKVGAVVGAGIRGSSGDYPTQIKETRTPTCDNRSHRTCDESTTCGHLLLSLLLAIGIAAGAQAQNLEKGKEINTTCAGCHGEAGQGGSKGEYPRLAGQRVGYLDRPAEVLPSRTRVNIPMYPYTQERELPDEDIKDVAAYLASIELPTKWPVFKDSDDALTRLTLTESA
jgi:cytochrome c553